MQNIKEVFKFIKLAPFIESFTTINVRGGLYHRINGKSTAAGKERDLTEDDKSQIKAGWEKMKKEVDEVMSKA